MSAICPDYLVHGLETVFDRIWRERMSDIPMLNSALQVEAVGFREWNGRCLGVMLTPWFMNLMLLPGEDDDWSDIPLGATELHLFPSGKYEFIIGEECGIGRYQMCSLFSPVFEFEDHAAAVATAEAVISALMDEENRDDVSTHEKEIEKIWKGESDDAISRTDARTAGRPRKKLSERVQEPMSRRDLLRGSFLQERE